MPVDGVTLTRLAAAVEDLDPVVIGENVRVVDIHHDSRQVTPGCAFVAIVGAVSDGHDYADRAVAAGAEALVVRHRLDLDHPQLVVADTRRALPRLASLVHGNPSRAVTLVGVTGTNGKTTVTHMIEAIARAAGMTAGLVGTVGARIDGEPVKVAHTTPESSDLQRLFATMRDRGVDVVAIEVSSHALDMGRVDATWFSVAAFTNLSQDHLDYHGDMETYYEAKASLFAEHRTGHAVIWVDDPAGARLAETIDVGVTRVGFGAAADISGIVRAVTPTHSDIELRGPGVRFTYRLRVPGRFNAANSLVAAACAAEIGIPWEAIKSGLEEPIAIPGRFQLVDEGQDFTVLVDYAHTPAAVANVIESVREMATGRIIVVVGSAGDRDPGKRPLMGAAASKGDIAIITSDNPRSEDPDALVDQVVAGATGHVLAVVDRRRAIDRALAEASTDDVVLILGKGHEQGQEFADRTVPFDDVTVAAEALIRMRGES